MSIKLQDAINNANTLDALLPIARSLEAKLSYMGSRWVEMRPCYLHYSGSAPLTAIAKRAREIITASGRTCCETRKFSNAEHQACWLLENAISAFYTTDEKNYDNAPFITKVILFIRSFFQKDREHEWEHDEYGDRPQIIKRNPGSNWDIAAQHYQN